MKKYIRIEATDDDKGTLNLKFKTSGFNDFEIIGLLTYYRDKIEIKSLHQSNEQQKTKQP